MNITIIGTAYPLRGGIAHYNALLAEALSVRHRVETITFSRQYPALLFPGKTQEETGGRVHGNPSPQLIDSINPLNWFRVGSMIRRRNPDLLLFKYWIPFFGPCFGTIARRVRRNGKTRVVCVCDNVLPHERRPFDRSFTRYALGPVDGFIVQSQAVERDLKEFCPDARYRLVPHPLYSMFGPPVDRARARTTLGLTARRVLLFFGYVRKYKGLDILLSALGTLPADLDCHLVVAGEFYEPKEPYLRQINDLGLGRRITLRSDYLPNEEVATYFSAADAVVLPYRSATQSGIAQIAYYYNLPVLATDAGGLAEVIKDGETGFVVPAGDPAALAGAIRTFCSGSLDEEFRRNIEKEKQHYSWTNMVDAIEALASPEQA